MDREQWIDLAGAACDDAGIEHGPIEILMTWDQKFVDADAYRNSAVFRIGGQRCLSTHLYSFSMEELWPSFAERGGASDAIVREMTAFFFPADVFGPPD